MLPFYKVEIVGQQGESLLTIDDAVSINAARAFNTDGTCTVIIPDYYPRKIFKMHARMILWRHDYDGVPRAFGKTVWFLKKNDHDYDSATYTLSFVDAFAMLKGRLVGYTSEGTYASKTMEEYEAISYTSDLRIANMMRAYVRENVGSLALDSDRIIASIQVEDDRNEGPFGEKQASFQELGAVLTDLARMADAKGTPMFYDLLPIFGGNFLFRVWSDLYGIDRGSQSENPLLLTQESGFITEIHEVEDYSNVASFCWALGEGTGGSQLIATGENIVLTRSDPFGRIEMTVAASDTSNVSVLADTAISALSGRLPKLTVACKVVENSSLTFQRDLDYGDKLQVQVGTQQYDCTLNAVSVTWQDGEEDLDLRLLGEVPLGSRAIFEEVTPPEPLPDSDPENQPPTVNAGEDQTFDFGLAAVLEGTADDDGLPDPPAVLTYAWSQTSGPGTAIFGEPAMLNSTATFDMPGVYVLRLTVSDGELSVFDELTVTITALNLPPEIDAGPDQAVPFPAIVSLSASASDDGQLDPLVYYWGRLSGPGSVIFGDDTALITTAAISVPGTYVLRISAFDGEFLVFDDMTITDSEAGGPNVAPFVNAGFNQTIEFGLAALLEGDASDDDLPDPPNAMTFLWTKTSGPGTAAFGTPTSLNTNCTFSAPGTYVLRLTADDSEYSSYSEVTITVT